MRDLETNLPPHLAKMVSEPTIKTGTVAPIAEVQVPISVTKMDTTISNSDVAVANLATKDVMNPKEKLEDDMLVPGTPLDLENDPCVTTASNLLEAQAVEAAIANSKRDQKARVTPRVTPRDTPQSPPPYPRPVSPSYAELVKGHVQNYAKDPAVELFQVKKAHGSEITKLREALKASKLGMENYKKEAEKELRSELNEMKLATELSMQNMHKAIVSEKEEFDQIEKAKLASIRSFHIDSKRPAETPPAIFQKTTIADQRMIENAVKGAGASTDPIKPSFIPVSDTSEHKYATANSVCYPRCPPIDNGFIAYAPTPKTESYIRRDEDSHDEDGKPMAVWCQVKRNAQGKLTHEPDLTTLCKEPMVPFDLQTPPAWVDMKSSGRNRISRSVYVEKDVSPHKTRRKTGQKHRDKRARDYAKAKRTSSYSQSDSDSDSEKESKTFKASSQNQHMTAAPQDDHSHDSSSSSDVNDLDKLRKVLASKRRLKQMARKRSTRSPISSDSDDYTDQLDQDLHGSIQRSSKLESKVSAKSFSTWWRENGTKWQGPTYDAKYPFNSWKQDWGRLLDLDSPYFESVPTPAQQRAWFWDTCGPQVRQHRHSIIEAGEKAKLLRLRSGVPNYGAIELIAAVHLFCYPEEETAARITEWNSLNFVSTGEKLLERWSTFYFYLRNFQYTLPSDMHTPTTLYLKLLTVVDKQPWWQHPLQVLELLGRDPDKIYNMSRSCISTWIRSSGNLRVPAVLPPNPPSTPTVSFATSSTNADPPSSPPPRSYRGTTHKRVHTNPIDKNGNVSKCNGCGKPDHWFSSCPNPDKYDYRRRLTSNLQRRIDRRPGRPDRRIWRDVSAYLTQNLDVSPTASPTNEISADPVDQEYEQSMASSEDNIVSSESENQETTDLHSHFTISEDMSSFYGNFSEEQGLKQDLYSMGLTLDNSDSSPEVFHGRRH